MALTAQQIRDRVLKKLGVVATGQSAYGEDAEIVDDIITDTFDEYSEHFVFAATSVPGWAVEPVIDMVAARAAPYFDFTPLSKTERQAFADYVTAKDRRVDDLAQGVELEFM